MKPSKYLWAMAVIGIGLIVWNPLTWAGNREMVEQRISELDRVNRQVVRQLPDLPRDGQVSVRARVLPDGTLLGPHRIRRRPAPGVPAYDDVGVSRLTDALSDGKARRPQIRGYRDANTDRAFTPLGEGLARWFKKNAP